MNTLKTRHKAEARVHTRSGGFTIITNSIFKDKSLSLKAKGLLCTVLSLPEEWDYSIAGLLKIINPCNEHGKLTPIQGQSRDGLYATLKELELCGYLMREQLRDEHGKTGKLIYHFYDTPVIPEDTVVIDQSDTEGEQNSSSQPLTGFPYTAEPYTVNPTQLNTNSNKGLKVSNISSSSSSSLKQASDKTSSAQDTSQPIDDEDGFKELCSLSLKTPNRNTIAVARTAYQQRLDQGYSSKQIIQAYQAYRKRYQEENDVPRFAKQLHCWLTENDGFNWYAGKPNRAVTQSSAIETSQKETEDEIRKQLFETDEYLNNQYRKQLKLMAQSLRAHGEKKEEIQKQIQILRQETERYVQHVLTGKTKVKDNIEN